MSNPNLKDRHSYAATFDEIMNTESLKIPSITKDGDYRIIAGLSIFVKSGIHSGKKTRY